MALIEQLLADKSEADLERMRETMNREIQTLAFDIQRIDRLLAEKRAARAALSHQPDGGTLRQRIIDLLEISNGPLAPKEIAKYLRQQHDSVFRPTRLYNQLSRMAREGTLAREDGLYWIPAHEGSVSPEHPAADEGLSDD